MTASEIIKLLEDATYWVKRKQFVEGRSDYFDSPLTIITQKGKVVVEKVDAPTNNS